MCIPQLYNQMISLVPLCMYCDLDFMYMTLSISESLKLAQDIILLSVQPWYLSRKFVFVMHFVSYGLFFLWSVYDFVYRFIDYSHITDISACLFMCISQSFKYSHNKHAKIHYLITRCLTRGSFYTILKFLEVTWSLTSTVNN